MAQIWNASGSIDNLEHFTLGDSYSVNIMVVDPANNVVLDSKMFTNISSTKTPLAQLIPKNFDVYNYQNVNLIIQDNTFYTTQSPMQLLLQYDQSQKPYLVQFDSIQKIANTNMRTAYVSNIPYKNIILYFKNG